MQNVGVIGKVGVGSMVKVEWGVVGDGCSCSCSSSCSSCCGSSCSSRLQ